ncbi:glycosyltransferase [Candidatus Gottesmanbacteria bacterium]|nr:glycosyltransferase [Candidatus Gottesmanbacteria bacterium]
MKNKESLVSVIMPVHNGGLFLREAMDSILGQTYQNFEFLIADDGSQDNTWAIINSYSSDKIKAFRFKKNRGAFPRTNFLFSQARGKFLAVMDGDDIAKPDRLEKQVNFMRRHSKIVVLGTQAEIINENGEIIGQKKAPAASKQIYEQFGFIHPMIHPSCLIRRSLLPKRKFLYRTDFGVNSDYQTFFEFLNYGQFANLPEFLLQYRIHGKNSSLSNLKNCFLNTLQIRWLAVTKYGYRMNWLSLILTLCQIPSILLLPTRLVDFCYPLIRGINFRYEKNNPHFNFTGNRNWALSG